MKPFKNYYEEWIKIKLTIKNHLDGNGSRITDGSGHGRVLVVPVDDHVDAALFEPVVRPVDAQVVPQDNEIALGGLKHKLLGQVVAEGVERSVELQHRVVLEQTELLDRLGALF